MIQVCDDVTSGSSQSWILSQVICCDWTRLLVVSADVTHEQEVHQHVSLSDAPVNGPLPFRFHDN